jgi:hypothetical protein
VKRGLDFQFGPPDPKVLEERINSSPRPWFNQLICARNNPPKFPDQAFVNVTVFLCFQKCIAKDCYFACEESFNFLFGPPNRKF